MPDTSSIRKTAAEERGNLRDRINCSWICSGSTRAMCPPGSLHDHIVKHWEFIRSYTIQNGHLFLSVMDDGGIYEFEPIARQAPQSGGVAPSSNSSERELTIPSI